MPLDITALFAQSNCRVIFTTDDDTAARIEDAIFAAKPGYRLQIHPALAPIVKRGPFTMKNKKSLWRILINAPEAKKSGPAFLQQQTKALNLYCYESRIPRVLSWMELERASVLYYALEGRREFLLNDRYYGVDENARTIAVWMQGYEGFKRLCCELVWITGVSKDAFLSRLGESAAASSFYSFFSVEGNKLVPCDPKADTGNQRSWEGKTESVHHRRRKVSSSTDEVPPSGIFSSEIPEKKQMTPEALYQEGRKYDYFSGSGVSGKTLGFPPEEDTKKAFCWYQKAAEAGSLKGQTALALMYSCGFGCEVSREKAFFWYAQAAFNEDYNKYTTDAAATLAYDTARYSLKAMLFQFNNGREALRKFAGDKAEAFIREAEEEKAREDALPKIQIDRDELRAFMDKFC